MPSSATPDRVAAVRHFNRFYTTRIGVLDEHHLESPFSLTEGRVLYEIAHRDRPTATEVGRELALDAGYLSRVLRRFAKLGLVQRTASPADARRSHLTLTKKGKRELATLEARACAAIDTMIGDLAPQDQEHLVRAMTSVARLLEPDDDEPFTLREHRIGDMAYTVARQAILYAEEYGWIKGYESLASRIAADFIDNFDPKHERCWIAERHGEIVGSVFVVRKSPTVAQLRMLYVEPAARGLGIGKRLVREVIAFCRALGYRKIVLWTNNVLTAARHIYEAEGFTLVSEEKHSMFGPETVGQMWELRLGRGART
jgi:DNA-binding MarR family transcriptional regulator/RimJ/RimL family protein N-acetyltransferase